MFLHHTIPAAVGAVALFAHGANTHMIMNLPTPYGFTTSPMVEVSPLDGVTYKYPCQGLYNSDGVVTTVVAGGAPTLVQFTGTAAHGGGSCQFSISYDDPEAGGGWNSSATFKTIYTLIGGCPVSAVGNLAYHGNDARGRSDGQHCGNDSGKECIRQFLIPFPKFLKNGRATFSWTWHNKIGNREIYQNCAPILITGGTGDPAQIDALPKIFLGDLPAVQSDIPDHTPCSLAQGQVVNYPNPGKYGRVLEPPTDPTYGKPDGYCSDVPPASALPTFVEDSRTIEGGGVGVVDPTQVTDSATYEQTPSVSSFLFITIPTDTAAGTPSTTAGGPTNTGAPIIGTTTGTTATTSSTKKSCGKPGSVLPAPSSPSGGATTTKGLSSSSEVDATGTTDSTEDTVTKTLTSVVTVMAHTVTVTVHRGCVPRSSSSSNSSTSTTQATSTVDGYGGGEGGSITPGTTISTSTTSTDDGGYGPGGVGSSGTTTTALSPSPPSSFTSTLTTTSTSTSTLTTVITVTALVPLATATGSTITAKGSTTLSTTDTPSTPSTTTPTTIPITSTSSTNTPSTTYMSAPTMPPVDSASYDHSYLHPCQTASDGSTDEGCWHFRI